VSDIVCISPVDGAEVARRRSMSGAEVAAALALAREAQTQWSQATLAERKTKMLKFLDAMKAQNDAIVPELAMQMGGRCATAANCVASRSACARLSR
jgi:acyl-CoA reductase-like NAD-dependent aldehyde dehydrogenase